MNITLNCGKPYPRPSLFKKTSGMPLFKGSEVSAKGSRNKPMANSLILDTRRFDLKKA